MNVTGEQRAQRNRLKTWMKRKGIDRQSFADKLGYKKEYIDQVLSGRNVISEIIELKLSKCYPGLNVTWVMTGEGDMFLPDGEEKEISSVEEPVVSYRTGGGVVASMNLLLSWFDSIIAKTENDIDRLMKEKAQLEEQRRTVEEMLRKMRGGGEDE